MNLHVFLVLSSAAFLFNRVECDTPTPEVNALVDIYHSLGGARWSKSTNWLHGDPCQNHWYGIKCSSGDEVTSITLDSIGLSGQIPDSIGNFPSLQFLCLEWNHDITGGIPDTISKLQNLIILTMPNEALSGCLTEAIGDSPIQILHLGGNNFTALPATIKNMKNVGSFAVEDNNLLSLPADAPPFVAQALAAKECGQTWGGPDCDLSGNPFDCSKTPLPEWGTKCCGAKCA